MQALIRRLLYQSRDTSTTAKEASNTIYTPDGTIHSNVGQVIFHTIGTVGGHVTNVAGNYITQGDIEETGQCYPRSLV